MTDSEMAVVEATVLKALQPITDQLRIFARELAELRQRLTDLEAEKKGALERRNLWVKIMIPICSALLIAFGAWVWNQHAATVELRVLVARNADAVADLTKTVGDVNRRSNSQGDSFTALKVSVDDVLGEHRKMLQKMAAVDWSEGVPLSSKRGKRANLR